MSDEQKGQEHRFSNSKELRQEILQMAAPPKRTLNHKILDIQRAITGVKKRGFNKEHGYKFLQIEDAVLACKKLIEKENLLLTPSLAEKAEGGYWFDRQPHATKGYMATVYLRWTLQDLDSGEERSWIIPGEGYDTTDKGSPKAITGSRKQALILIFNLPIGDNAEANSASVEREVAKQAAQDVARSKIAQAASQGQQSAIDALSQEVPVNKIKIGRPESFNGHYISVSGFLAPQLQQYFADTSAKHVPAKGPYPTFWKLASEYEQGLIKLCEKLNIEVEG